jgi:anti-anti-sigma factor
MLSFESTQRKGKVLIKVVGDLTIYTSVQARKEFVEALEAHLSPEIDLSGVEEIDTAGIQVLLWAKQEAVRHGRSLPFVSHSQAVLEVLDLLNLAGTLGDPILLAPPHS